jgi:hypothetical protein
MNRKNHNAQDLEYTPNVSVGTKCQIITIVTLVRNLAQLAKIALVRDLCSFPQDLNNVECIG